MNTQRYTLILTPAEEGGYTVTVPALPPVITEGDTFDEAVTMAREAIELYVEFLIEQGEEIPAEAPEMLPQTAEVHVSIPLAS